MTIATTQQSPISHCLSQLNDQTYSRQSSTPLSFHSVVSSTTDEQIPSSPLIISKTQIFTDIVNELIQGAKGLDKLSYSLANFTKSIHDFIRLTTDKQTEKVKHLENELEKYVNIFGLFFFRRNLFICSENVRHNSIVRIYFARKKFNIFSRNIPFERSTIISMKSH